MSDRWVIFRHRRYNRQDVLVEELLPEVAPWRNDVKIGEYITEFLCDVPDVWTRIPHDSIKMFADRREALVWLHQVIRYKGYNEIEDAPDYGVDIHPGDRYA